MAREDFRHRGRIALIPSGTDRPLWSVMIPTFNCADVLRQSLASVLAQAPGPDVMQICVVDDASTKDDPALVIRELGEGRVEFFRQPLNLGHVRNFNVALGLARGQLVHLLHGDDWIGPGFYERMAAPFAGAHAIGAAFCRHAITNPDGSVQRISPLERPTAGVLDDWLISCAASLRLQPPSMVVRRSVYETLGGFDTRVRTCGEDWEMWVRIANQYPVAFEPEVLAFYRDGADTLTKRSIRSGQNIRDVRCATRIAHRYLADGPAEAAIRQARISWADWALFWAHEMAIKNQPGPAVIQLWEALRCSLDADVRRRALAIAKVIYQRRDRFGQAAHP
jgi:glycosyltransferase involved in cell wall biosynthesis